MSRRRIRAFAPEDRTACLEVFDSNVPGAFRPEERADFERFLQELPGTFLVIEEAGKVLACGGVAVEPDEPRTGSLCWGMVRQDLHGRGLGRVLLEARIRALEEGGAIDTLRLETIPDTVPFFRHMGFEVAEEDPDGYGPGLPRVELRRAIESEDIP